MPHFTLDEISLDVSRSQAVARRSVHACNTSEGVKAATETPKDDEHRLWSDGARMERALASSGGYEVV
jgi:hypothetical protein